MKKNIAGAYSLILVLFSLGGVVLNLLQVIFAIDHETGFYAVWHFSIPALDFLLITGVLLFGIIAFLFRGSALTGEFPGGSVGTGVFCAFSAVGLFGQFTLSLFRMTEPSFISLLSLLVTALCFAGFLALVSKRESLSETSGFFLAFRSIVPALWGCLQMILLFFEESVLSNTSEHILSILFLGSATVFFIKLGLLSFPGNGKKGGFILLFSGALTALFGFTFALTDFIGCLTGIISWNALSPLSCAVLPFAAAALGFVEKNSVLLKKN